MIDMIDIHAHILPGVDDGSRSMEESLKMIRMAQDSGVKMIVATPHLNIPGMFYNYASKNLAKVFENLQTSVKEAGLSTRIVRGMEVFATEQTPRLLEEGKIWTINDTRYFMIEFAFDEDSEFCNMILEDCADMGYIPVIAHPERYYFVQRDPQLVYEWYCRGYGIQMNKGSILGRFGNTAYETALLLLEHGVVNCVASDAHASYQRTTHMSEVRRSLETYFGRDYCNLMMKENPGRILKGEELRRLDPIPFGGGLFY